MTALHPSAQIVSRTIAGDSQSTGDGQLARPNQLVAILGFGGTGHIVLNEIKARFLAAHGALPDTVALVCFDCAEDPVSSIDHHTGAIVTLERGTEFIRLDKVPLYSIKRNLERHSPIVERVGLDVLRQINRTFIIDGAAQERIQGLLAYLWNASLIEQVIAEMLDRLMARPDNLDGQLMTHTTIKAFLVGSIAGGQGGGALLDGAFLTRQLLVNASTLGASASLIGALVLPAAFREKENGRMRANAYSFALEANSLMLGQLPFAARYPSGTQIQMDEAPFDYCLVFDGIDEYGRNWANRNEICSLAAQTIWLLASSAVGMHQINSALNEAEVLYGISPAGFGSYLGSAGVSAIVFPARQVAERCGLRHVRAILTHLLAEVQAAETDREAPETELPPIPLASDAGLRETRKRLHTNQDGAPLQIVLSPPAALEQLPVEEVPTRTRNLADNYLRRRIFQEAFAQLATQRDRVEHSQLRILTEQLGALLSEGRLVDALVWLRQTNRVLARQVVTLTQEQTRLAERVDQAQTLLQNAGEVLDHATEGFLPIFVKRQVRSALNSYLDTVNALAQLLVEQHGSELMANLLHAVTTWCQHQLHTLELVIARLQQAYEWLITYEAELAQLGHGTEISLADSTLIDDFYHRYASDVRADSQRIIAHEDGLLAWAEISAEASARQLLERVAPNFAAVQKLSVEEVLVTRWPDRSPQHWVERLKELAAAAWNLDRALLENGGAGLASFLTIGVPDAATSIFANSGHTLISTRDPERILALRTVYGGSFDALKPFALWQPAYTRFATMRPLHVLRNFQQDDDRSEQLFALGLIYTYIDNEGAWYYYRPADPLQVPLRLGHGRDRALAALANQRTLQQELIDRIEAQIAADGMAQTAARITQWVEQRGDTNLALLRKAARDYLAELQKRGG